MSQVKELADAINEFIVGCKSDGIWDAIKACGILAGWNNLSGCLTPLKGPAPTNINFAGTDYDRVSGLKGNGSTKYLNSNRNNNADPQNSHHLAFYVTEADTTVSGNPGFIGTGGAQSGESVIGYATSLNPNVYFFRSRSSGSIDGSGASRSTGLHAISRINSTTVNTLLPGVSSSNTLTSQTPRNATIRVFGRESSPYFNGRASFYSIGEALDLAKLNTRVTALMSAFSNL
jgi:hypothetical protein